MFYRNQKKSLWIAIFILIIAGLSVGYALYNQNLRINGAATIKENSWIIYFDNIVKQDGSIAALNEESEAKIIDEKKTQIRFGINFKEPGEKYEFIVDIVNDGTLDAMIDTFQIKGFEEYGDVFEWDVRYLDGTPVRRCDELKAKTRRKVRVIATYGDVSNKNQLPNQTKTVELTFDVKYIQEDDKTCDINHDTTVKKNLTINPNGGIYNETENTTTIVLERGEKYTFENPVRGGYLFDGWVVTPSENYDETSNMVTMVDSDITAVAKWANSTVGSRTITIDPKGGVYNGTTEPTIIEKEVGEEYELLVPTKEGYEFDKWIVTPSEIYNEETGKIIIGEENVEIEATWKEIVPVAKYTITINPNGGKYNNETGDTTIEKEAGEEYELLTPTKEGYEFDGWTVTPSSAYDENNNKIVVAEANVSVVAKWKKIESTTTKYTVTINPNGGKYNNETGNTTIEKEAGEEYELLTPTKEGYEFDGWTVSGNGYDETSNKITVTENITLVAKWVEVPIVSTHTITIDPNGGIYNNETTATVVIKTEGEEYELLVPTYENHEFDGWTVTPSSAYDENNNKIVVGEENISVVAKWKVEEVSKFTVTISPNGGTYDNKTDNTVLELNEGIEYEVLTPTRESYEFDGWTVSGNGYNETTNKITVTENIVLTAKWKEEIPKYNITINPNGGTYNEESSATIVVKASGEEYEVLTPVREEYSFTGWTVVPEGAYNEGTKKVTVGDSDVSLTANWVETNPSYRLIINPNGGIFNDKTTSTVVPLKNGETYVVADPEREGYSFNGWTSSNASAFDENTKTITMGTSEIELTANWLKYYTITINPNGGTYTGETSIDVLENTTYSELSTPTYEGFQFLGWEVVPSGSYDEDTNVITVGTANVSLTATWKDLDEENQIAAGNVARINKTYYPTINSAFESANTNDIINVITDTTEDVLNDDDSKVLILDLGKHTVTGKLTNNGNLKLRNGTITNTSTNTIVNNSTLSLISGTYANTSGTTIVNNGSLTMGTNDSVVYVNDSLNVSGVEIALDQKGIFYFYDGYLTASTGLEGDFDSIPTNYSIYVEHIDANGYQKVYPAIVNDNSVARVSKGVGKDYYFAHLQDAINNAEKWEVPVYTIRDFIASYDVKVDRNKTIEIDLTNGTPTFARDLVNDGTLTLKNGTVAFNSNKIVNNRNLTFDSIVMNNGSIENYGKVTNNKSRISINVVNHSSDQFECIDAATVFNSITNDAEGFSLKNCNVSNVTNTATFTVNGGKFDKITNSGLIVLNGVTIKATGTGVTGGTVKVYDSNISGYTKNNNLVLFDDVSDLYIKDSTLSTTSCYSRDDCYAIRGGKLEMENTTVTNGSQNSDASIINILNGSKITGGTITNTLATGIASYNSEVEIDGTTIEATTCVSVKKVIIDDINCIAKSTGIDSSYGGVINKGIVQSKDIGVINGGGELVINDITINAYYEGIYVNGSKLILKGGTIIASEEGTTYATAIYNSSYGTIIIDTSEENRLLGKQVYLEGNYAIANYTGGPKIEIGDAKLVSTTGYAIYNSSDNSSGYLILGKEDDEINDSYPEIIGETYGVYARTAGFPVKYFDGVVKGQTAPFTKMPDQIPDSAVYLTKTEMIDEKEYIVSSLELQDDFLQIGSDTYNSFEKALADVGSSATIKVIKDAMVGHDFEIPEEKDITIDFNGKTLTFSGKMTNNANLTLKDSSNSSKISMDGISSGSVVNNGNLTFVSGNYRTSSTLVSSDSNVQINGGKFEIVIDGLSNGYIVKSTGRTVIDGGEFITTRSPNTYDNWYIYGKMDYEYSIVSGGEIVFNNGTINAEIYSNYRFIALYSSQSYYTYENNSSQIHYYPVIMNGGTISISADFVKNSTTYDYYNAALGGMRVIMNDGVINVTVPEEQNGHAIIGSIGYKGAISGGAESIVSGSITVSGANTSSAIFGNAGTIEDGVTLESSGACFQNGTIVINGGNYTCYDGFTELVEATINDGEFTIENNGFVGFARITLNDGTMTTGNSLIINETNNSENITINGGTYETNGEDYAINSFRSSSGKLNINGGTIIANHGAGIKTYNLNMGLFDNEEDGAPDVDDVPVLTTYLNSIEANKINIASGIITSLSENGLTTIGTITPSLNIGIDDGEVFDDILVITGKKTALSITDKTPINIYDGILKGVTKSYDGVVYGLPDGYTLVDDTEDIGDDEYQVSYLEELGDFLKVGRMTYNNFGEAIEDIAGSGTIQLLRSAPVNNPIVFPEGKDITLDLDGNSLMLRQTVTVDGTLTITTNDDNSGISSIISSPINVSKTGTLNIINGSYTGVDELIVNSGYLNTTNAYLSVYNSDYSVKPTVVSYKSVYSGPAPTFTMDGGKIFVKYYIDPDDAVYLHPFTYNGEDRSYWMYESSNYALAIGPEKSQSYTNASNGIVNINNAEIEVDNNNPYCTGGDERVEGEENSIYCSPIKVREFNGENVVLKSSTSGLETKGGVIKNLTVNSYSNGVIGSGTINGANISVVDSNGINGSFDLYNVNVNAKNRAVTATGGNVYSGSIVSDEGIGLYLKNTVNIGAKDDHIDNDSLSIIGDTYGIYISDYAGEGNYFRSVLNLYDGVIKGKTGAIFGVVKDVENNSNVYMDVETIDDEEYYVTYLKELGYTIMNVTQNIKSRSLKSAVETSNAGDELKLIDDFQLYEPVEIAADKELSLDMDGHDFALNNQISIHGSLTVKDTNDDKGILTYYNGLFYDYGTLVLNGLVVRKNDAKSDYLVMCDGHTKSDRFIFTIINSDLKSISETNKIFYVTQTFNGDSDNKMTIIGSTIDAPFYIYDNVDLSIQDSVLKYGLSLSNEYAIGNIKDSTIGGDLYITAKNANSEWNLENLTLNGILTVKNGQGEVNISNSHMRYITNSGNLNIDSTDFTINAQDFYDEDPTRRMYDVGGTAIENKGNLLVTNSSFNIDAWYVNSSNSTVDSLMTVRPIFNTFYSTTSIGTLVAKGNTFNVNASKRDNYSYNNHLNSAAILNNSSAGFESENNTFNVKGDSIYFSIAGDATIKGDHGTCVSSTSALYANTGTIDVSNSTYDSCHIQLDGATINSTKNTITKSGDAVVVKSGTLNSTSDTINGGVNNSGTITFDKVGINSTVYNKSGATLNFNSGNVVTTNSYGINNSGTLNLGVFDGTGTDESDVAIDTPHIESSYYAIYGSGVFNYYDGVLLGKSGSYYKNPDGVETNYEPVLYYDVDTGYYRTILEYVYSNPNKYIAIANNVKYTSLPLAINKASGTIQILDNINGDVKINRTSTIDLNGKTINGQVTVESGYTLSVFNGRIVNSEGTAVVNKGYLNVGKNDNEVSNDSIIIVGGDYGVESKGTMSFYDGTIYGVEDAVSGDIAYVASAHTEKKGTGNIEGIVYKTLYLTDALDFVQVGGNTYNSLSQAFAAVPSYQGNMDDVTVVSLIGDGRVDSYVSVNGKNVMLDLNGHTLYSGYSISISGPNFVVTDSSASKTGRVVTTANNYAFNNNSTLHIEGGNYGGIYGIVSGNGLLTVDSAKFNYDVSTSNSIYALSVSGNTTVTNSEFDLKNNSNNSESMYAISANGVLNISDTDISVESSGSGSGYTYGINGPYQLTMENVNVNINNYNTSSSTVYGINTYSGSGSISNLKNVEFNINAPNNTGGYVYGAYIYSSTTVLDNVHLTMKGGTAQAYGAYIGYGGEHTIKNSSFDVDRDTTSKYSNYVYGVYTSGGVLTITDTDITASNSYSQVYGLSTYANLTMKDCDVVINAKDGYAYGIYSSSPSDIDNVTVDMDIVGPFENYKSSSSYGMYVSNGTIKNSSIDVLDLAPQGYVYALQGGATVTDTNIYAKGINVYGTSGGFQMTGGSIELEDVQPENEAYTPTFYAVNNGSFSGVNIKSTKSCVSPSSNLVLSNLTMECGTSVLYGSSYGNVTFANVDLTSTDGFTMYNGTINYIGGSMNISNDAVYFNKNSTNAVFNIGVINDEVGSAPVITAGRYGVYKNEEAGQVNFYDGVIRAKEEVIIGEFDAYEAEKELVISNQEIDGEVYKVTSFE